MPRKSKTLIEACRDIVEHKQHAKWQGMRIDLFSAQAYVKVYDSLNEENKKKLEKMIPAFAFSTCFKMITIAQKQ